MSNTEIVLSFADLATRYADADYKRGNASDRLAAHPDAPTYVERGAQPKPKGKGTMAATVAREVLGAAPDFSTRVRVDGVQILNPDAPVLARRVESLTSWLTAQAKKAAEESAPVMRVTLKGTGSAVIPEDHPLYEQILAYMTGGDTDGDTDGE